MRIDYKNLTGADNQTHAGLWMTSSHKLQAQFSEIQSALRAGRSVYVQTSPEVSFRLKSIDENEAELDTGDLFLLGESTENT